MKKTKLLWQLFLVLPLLALASCSESDGDDEEYPNWKDQNERAFNAYYTLAQSEIESGSKEWKIINVFSKSADIATLPEDHIVVKVLNEGIGTGYPLYTDTVSIHYRGRLIPSKSYSEGKIFDSSWSGEYSLATMKPFEKLPVSNFIDGVSTALQHMKIGDRWEVYIPWQLGYGSKGTSTGSIPGYSMLTFDLTLIGYSRVGTTVPSWKVSGK